MANGWTPSRRAAQSTAIRRWQPWMCSTGPRTAEGKRRVSRNAYRGGHRPAFRATMQRLRELLAEHDNVLQGLE